MSLVRQPHDDSAIPPTAGAPLLLKLWLFGTMAATDRNGTSVLPSARKTRAVLAVLALDAPRTVLRARLTGLLWSSRENKQARASLRQAVHDLQEALGEPAGALLWVDRNQLALRDDALWVDVKELTRTSANDPTALELLKDVLLEDLDGLDPIFDHWLVAERTKLHCVARDLGESILAAQNDPDAVITAAKQLLAIVPSHEGAWRGIIGAHLDRADRGAAFSARDRWRAAVATLDLAPPAGLVAPIDEIRRAPPHTGGATFGGANAAVQRDGGTRLGVMPMRLLDGLGEDPLSLGLAEEITTALSRFRWISCVSSTSLAALAAEPQDGTLWERLDLDFMLDGTVQRSGGRVRITCRLIDMRENGAVIWARRFDRGMIDILALQDEIAAETAAQVDPELLLREGDRAVSRPPPPNSTAYELMLRAIPAIYRLEQSGYLAAGDMLRAAIAIDPGHASSHAWLAYWHLLMVGQGWAKDPIADTVRAGMLADRAVTLDPNDARGLTLSGHVRAFLGKRSKEGIALHQRALSLNPNLPIAWAFYGLAQCYLGAHDEAIRCIQQAHRLSPFDPHAFVIDSAFMLPYLLKRDYETALQIGRRSIQLNPDFSATYKGVLSVLGHLGRTAEASALLVRLLVLEPRLTLDDAIKRSPILQHDDLAHYAEGLRLAGLP